MPHACGPAYFGTAAVHAVEVTLVAAVEQDVAGLHAMQPADEHYRDFVKIGGATVPRTTVIEDGMVGFEMFQRFVVRIDYGASTITLMDPARIEPRGAGTPVPFNFYEHMPQVAGHFAGIPARFDIDTGSRSGVTLAILLPAAPKAQGKGLA